MGGERRAAREEEETEQWSMMGAPFWSFWGQKDQTKSASLTWEQALGSVLAPPLEYILL